MGFNFTITHARIILRPGVIVGPIIYSNCGLVTKGASSMAILRLFPLLGLRVFGHEPLCSKSS